MNQIAQVQPIESVETAAPEPATTSPDRIDVSEVPRPDHIPEKFWNADQGTIRAEELLKSYGELERRFGEGSPTVPESPDEYELEMPADGISPDEEVNTRLHAAGFSQEQAQLVYDLAHEKLAPLMAQMGSALKSETDISQLEAQFGGKAKWQEASRQIKAWGQSALTAETFNALSASVDGVKTMHRMMKTDEPALIGNRSGVPGGRSEADLKQMMKDPRYWRDQDPGYVEQVRKGFQSLYPD